jgi:hypothetical protein
MDLIKYPNARHWLTILAQNEQGMMILLLIALGIVSWLFLFRPHTRVMLLARYGLLIAFFISAITMVISKYA